MKGNPHIQLLGEEILVMTSLYPTFCALPTDIEWRFFGQEDRKKVPITGYEHKNKVVLFNQEGRNKVPFSG